MIAVVGGGVIGLSVAYYLSRAGEEVVLYERGELTSMAVYVLASVVASILGLFAGLFLMRQLV